MIDRGVSVLAGADNSTTSSSSSSASSSSSEDPAAGVGDGDTVAPGNEQPVQDSELGPQGQVCCG